MGFSNIWLDATDCIFVNVEYTSAEKGLLAESLLDAVLTLFVLVEHNTQRW